jgi:hypothetical protein
MGAVGAASSRPRRAGRRTAQFSARALHRGLFGGATLRSVVIHEQPVWLYADDGHPESADYADNYLAIVPRSAPAESAGSRGVSIPRCTWRERVAAALQHVTALWRPGRGRTA